MNLKGYESGLSSLRHYPTFAWNDWGKPSGHPLTTLELKPRPSQNEASTMYQSCTTAVRHVGIARSRPTLHQVLSHKDMGESGILNFSTRWKWMVKLHALLYLHAKTPSIYHPDTVVRRKIVCLCQESNPNHPVHSQSYGTVLTLSHGSKLILSHLLE